MGKIVYKDLSYEIVGILFYIVKELGSSYHEKYYQRAVEVRFKKLGIPFEREHKVNILINGDKIGHHFVDFVVDKKIVLEIKKGNFFRMADVKQVLMYLKSTNYRLGLLAYFGNSGVRVKRVLNSSHKDI
jgi:GxxExxY protein